MDFLPIFHQTNDKRCLIVGGVVIASRRAKVIADAGLCIDVIAPKVSPDLVFTVNKSGGMMRLEAFDQNNFNSKNNDKPYFLIIAATNSRSVNADVCDYAKKNKILVNIADDSQASDFIFPSIITRDSITIAISNNGASPVLSRLLKEKIDAFLPERYGQLSMFVGKYRDKVKGSLPNVKARVKFWEKVLQGSIAQQVFAGNDDVAHDAFLVALNAAQKGNGVGEAYLIDASAGETDLLTLHTFRLLQQSEVILYDELVSKDIQSLIQQGDKRTIINVDKKQSITSSIQEIIHYIRQEKRVARLFSDQSNFQKLNSIYADAIITEGFDVEVALGVSSVQ